FGRLRGGARPEERRAADAEATAARARAALSNDVSQRTATLATQQAVTDDEAQRSRLQAENDAAIAAAYQERASAVARPWSRDVAVSEASVRQAEAGLAVASARLSLRTVRAPSSGTVLQVFTRAGERTETAGNALLTLGDLSRLRVRLDVDERDVNHVHTGQRGYVIAPGQNARRFNGAIQETGLHMGRKNQRTDEPTERIDTKILEAVILLDESVGLVQGQRVTGFLKVE
ncbi:MAG TPA: HlyD family efflux transporter periplasmic adaptor subunit, partial [Polyangiaceae bacterium]